MYAQDIIYRARDEDTKAAPVLLFVEPDGRSGAGVSNNR